jgi:hypothetical protein
MGGHADLLLALDRWGNFTSQGSQLCRDSSPYAGQMERLTILRLRDYIYIFHVPRPLVMHMTTLTSGSLPRFACEP